MATNLRQSKDVLHPIAFEFIDKCARSNVKLNPDEINAIDFLTRALVSENLWDKFKAIYPFVGRTAESHKFNLKNLNLHNIVWYNTSDLRHDKNGVTNIGAGYGNTVVAPSWFSDNNIHISAYHGTMWGNINESAPIIGSSSKSDLKEWMHTISLRAPLPIKNLNGSFQIAPVFTYSCGYSTSTSIRFAGTDASETAHIETYGFIVGVNGIKCYVNGNIYGRQGTLSDNSSLPINKPNERINETPSGTIVTYIPNLSQFPFLLFTNGRLSSTSGQALVNIRFASIGYELSDNENKKLYQIVQEFQRILGRNVEPIFLATFEKFIKEQVLTSSLNINKIFVLKTKPYREILNKRSIPIKSNGEIDEDVEFNRLTANVNISKIEVFGPRRIFYEDTSKTSVSILSLNEI